MANEKASVLKLLAQEQVQVKAIFEHLGAEGKRLLEEHLAEREPLLVRRFELVTGSSEPTEEELKGYDGPRADAGKGSGAKALAPGKGLPYFWLNALCGHDTISEQITRRDRQALGYCTDVRFVKGARGMLIEFHFCENPFFDNSVLRKGIYVHTDVSGRPIDVREEATEIEWKEGQSLLVKETRRSGKQAGKKGKKGEAEPGRRRVKACPSFFRFFTPISILPGAAARGRAHDPTAFGEEDEVEEEEEEAEEGEPPGSRAHKLAMRRKEGDGKTLNLMVKQVVPRAVHLYLGGPLMGDGRGKRKSGGGGDDEDDEDDDGFEVVSGAAGGDVNALPPHAQTVLHALKVVQDGIDAACLKFKVAKYELKAEEERRRQAMAEARRKLLLRTGTDGGQYMAVPNFWMRALRALDSTVDCVQRRDERALAYLSDVRLRWDFDRPLPSADDPTRAATLELSFLPGCPYFANTLLRKRYVFRCVGGSWSRLAHESSEVLEGPQWLEGRDLTVKTGPNGKERPAATLFALFKPGALRQAFDIVGDGRAAQVEATKAEEALLNDIQSKLVVRPRPLYDAVDMDDELPEEGDDDESDEDGGDDEEDLDDADGEGDGGEGEGAAGRQAATRGSGRRARRTKPAAVGGSGGSPLFRLQNWPLLLLLAVVAVTIAFVFADQVAVVRSRFGFDKW
ncbi:hypothetical protein FOA52_012468 [Chlamydomonas sp. UWO 241]|nr:hypothetical protein FOA52_012468 [Chlamydomonas sp. UWO 241]